MIAKTSMLAQRRRKALFFAPLVVYPVLTVLFIAMGGGKGQAGSAGTPASPSGFNKRLPDAHLSPKDNIMNKLGFYKKAELDSEQLRQKFSKDPYWSGRANGTSDVDTKKGAAAFNSSVTTNISPDDKASQLLQNLEQLKKAVADQQMHPRIDSPRLAKSDVYEKSPEELRLQHLIQMAQTTNRATDPQLERLQGMLDKVYQLQHPDQVSNAKHDSVTLQKSKVLDVSPHETAIAVEQLDSSCSEDETVYMPASTSFIDIDSPGILDSASETTIAAVIPIDQQLISGATIELRLLQDAAVGKIVIPQNTLVYGRASISGDRLQATITSIRTGASIYPVNLQLYDLDGLPGLHIPGAISRDVAKESADQGVNALGLASATDGTVQGQAANATIQAAKTLFSRKIRLVRVTIKSGYQVLLKNTKN